MTRQNMGGTKSYQVYHLPWPAGQSIDLFEKVGESVVDIFWKTEVIGKRYYVRSANERGWYIRWVFFLCFFVVVGIRYVFDVSYGGRDAELERHKQWLLVALFELLVFVDVY